VVPTYDWSDSVYGDVKEDVPKGVPVPLGKPVVTVSYVDANLLHCLVTGRSVTGILHFLNGTPIDWYSKKMATVETATYGAEYVSARTCVEQLVDLRNTLRYLGVPLRERSYMFGDNESVVNSSIQPHAKLHKRHNALSFHRVREAIASGSIVFLHIPGENNPADILSKHWGYTSIWHMLKTIMYVEGETIDSPGRSDKSTKGTSTELKANSCSSGSGSISISPRKVSAYLHSVGKSPYNHCHGSHTSEKLSKGNFPSSSMICLSPAGDARLVTNTAKPVTILASASYTGKPVTILASSSYTGKLKLQKERIHGWAVGDHPFLMEKGRVVERSVGDHPLLMEKVQVVERSVGDHPLLTSLTNSDADESSPDRDPESHHLHPLEIVLK
jgi:hypothetical protein